MKKAVFFDIDGTIMDAVGGIRTMRDKVRNAIRKLQSAGNLIFIATGRPYAFLQKELLDFGFDGFVMNNGAIVLVGDKIIFRHNLSNSDVKKVCNLAVAENLEYFLEDFPYTYTKKNFAAVDAFFKRAGADLSKIIYDFDIDKISVSKIECTTNRTDLEEINKSYNKILATPGFTGWADPFHFKILETYSDKVSKETGIFKVLEHFNIPVENSYAFGDGLNDYEMLTKVGTGIAMGTAKENIKRAAKFVVPSIHEDGVAVGIEKYILGAD